MLDYYFTVVCCVFSTFVVNSLLDVGEIARCCYNVKYVNQARVEMQLRSPSATAVIYQSGKIIVMGSRNEKEAGMAALKLTRIIAKALHRDLEMERLEIRSVRATSYMPFRINLAKLRQSDGVKFSYEPEIAPYGTLRVEDPKATANIFSTGSISITASSEADVHAAMEQIYAIVKEYRIN